jgi:hypothetical protein
MSTHHEGVCREYRLNALNGGGEFHVLTTLQPRGSVHITSRLGGWLGPRTSLDMMVK